MAFKAAFLLLICILAINTKVSSEWDKSMLIEGAALSPAESPIYYGPPPPPETAPAPSPMVPPASEAAPAPSSVVVPPSPAPPARRPRNILECIPQCVVRCKSHVPVIACFRDCLTCCGRCRCVPSGQCGNREQCGTCYTGMKKREGKPRCP